MTTIGGQFQPSISIVIGSIADWAKFIIFVLLMKDDKIKFDLLPIVDNNTNQGLWADIFKSTNNCQNLADTVKAVTCSSQIRLEQILDLETFSDRLDQTNIRFRDIFGPTFLTVIILSGGILINPSDYLYPYK